jgi:hypothetical protein
MPGAEEEPGEDSGEEIDVEAVLAQPGEQKETENPHDQDPDLEVPPEEDEVPEGGVPEAGGGQPISARCSRRFTAVHNSGTRPLSRITANDLRHGRSGFVTHATVSQAFTPGGHTDPGRGFPLDHYMQLVKQFAREIQA